MRLYDLVKDKINGTPKVINEYLDLQSVGRFKFGKHN